MTREARSSRHRSREVALQVLYALDLETARASEAPPAQEVFERVAANFEMPEGARAFAKELVLESVRRGQELDARIAAHARNWRIERMAAVDRNVLRLATYELLSAESPQPVVIDEAVELARHFGSETSPGFVNGILDAIARAQREETQ